MVLVVDVGNTNIVFAVFDADNGGKIRGQWRLSTIPEITADELSDWLDRELVIANIEKKSINLYNKVLDVHQYLTGYLLNNKGERFMKTYASGKMELAPRDIVSRSMMTEMQEGRGFQHETGVGCMKLDLRHLGEEKIKEKLGGIREISIKF